MLKFTNFLNLIYTFNLLPVYLKTFLISRLKLNSNMLYWCENFVMILSIFIIFFALAPFFLSATHNNVLIIEVCNKWRTVIYKTRNTGTGDGMRGMQGTQRMLTRGPRNFLEDSEEWYHFNVWGECSKKFREMFEKFPANVMIDSLKWSRRFRRMFKKIPVSFIEDSGECSRGNWGMHSILKELRNILFVWVIILFNTGWYKFLPILLENFSEWIHTLVAQEHTWQGHTVKYTWHDKNIQSNASYR